MGNSKCSYKGSWEPAQKTREHKSRKKKKRKQQKRSRKTNRK